MDKYCWQQPGWPNFTFDLSRCEETLYRYARESGKAIGAYAQLNLPLQQEASIDLMVNEAVKTAQIEGELLDLSDVRSSLRNHLGLARPPERVTDLRAEGIAALLLEVHGGIHKTVNRELLYHWHRTMLPEQTDGLLSRPIARGQWRASDEPMQIASGPVGYETVHYEAPPSAQVEAEMAKLFEWYEKSNPLNEKRALKLPGPVRAGIAHFWFEAIHPFEDGNGRIGRALAEHALAQELGQPAIISLSSAIKKERKAYYQKLHDAGQATLDLTDWLTWFCEITLEAQTTALAILDFVLMKARFWERHKNTPLNDRQQKVLRKLFDAGREGFEGGLTAKKYVGMTGCSKATATRDLTDMLQFGCLTRLEGGGRSVKYALALC